MGAFGSDSTANDNRQSAGDAAVLIRGSKTKLAQPGGTVLDLERAQLAPTIKGTKGNVTINDPAPIANLAGQFTDSIKDVANAASASLGNALQQQAATVQSALDKVTDVSTNAQTGGDSSRNKIVLYVVLAALTLLGVVFYFRKI